MDKYICIETQQNKAWNVYEFQHKSGTDTYMYHRYDIEGVRFFTSQEACEAEVERLNKGEK
jgi:hypothetical protein